MTFRIRNARRDDLASLVALVPRLRAFGSQPLRTDAELDGAEVLTLTRAVDALAEHALLLVAERTAATPSVVGVAYAETSVDYFTREKHGHLGILAVSREAEGKGAGRALMHAVESWAAGRGYRFITLNVFAQNERARMVYERAGYAADTIRYAKPVSLPRYVR